mgnify:FL=1|jgi:hypothetical protein|tara:strand:+ start:1888 stop:2439 length:552 start_codon:yes stop_codon:yes gene_type:complete
MDGDDGMGRPCLLSPEQIRYVKENYTATIHVEKGDGIDGRRHEKKDHSKLSAKELAVKFNVGHDTIKRILGHGRYRITATNSNNKRTLLLKKVKQKCVEYKGGKCSTKGCDYNKSVRALDFHHLDHSTKSFCITQYICSGSGSRRGNFLDENKEVLLPDILIQELDKCILLCANCHRELHDDE